jgi:hypothetical protein
VGVGRVVLPCLDGQALVRCAIGTRPGLTLGQAVFVGLDDGETTITGSVYTEVAVARIPTA